MSLAAAIDESVAAMQWLQPSDRAAVALARAYAVQIDIAIEAGDADAATRAMYLAPHVLNALRALGGTPAERKALGVEEEAHGKLAQLRAIRGGKSA